MRWDAFVAVNHLTRISRISTALAALIFGLGACTAFETPNLPPCPEILLLADTVKQTRFAEGPGRDIIDIVHEAEVTRVIGACEYDVDDDTGEGTIDVELSVAIELARGNANADNKAKFGYFVALTDLDEKVLQKGVFDGEAEFPGNQSRILWRDEPVTITIPIKKGVDGSQFELFVGMDLSRDEVEYNRTHRSTLGR